MDIGTQVEKFFQKAVGGVGKTKLTKFDHYARVIKIKTAHGPNTEDATRVEMTEGRGDYSISDGTESITED